MSRRIAIGDIHGCLKTLRQLVETKIKLQPKDELYCLGDYIDRGPDSKGVLDYLMNLQANGQVVRLLRGNHEDLMINAPSSPKHHRIFMANGGDQTLKSFGAESIYHVPREYLKFLRSTEHFIELDNCYLVHAGFNFDVINPFDDYNSMYWIRNMKVNTDTIGDKRIFHGHTTASLESIQENVAKKAQVINIDNGCVYLKHSDKNLCHLVGIDIDTLELFICANQETKPY
jgi:serine/threonine protein phosphatase 1